MTAWLTIVSWVVLKSDDSSVPALSIIDGEEDVKREGECWTPGGKSEEFVSINYVNWILTNQHLILKVNNLLNNMNDHL